IGSSLSQLSKSFCVSLIDFSNSARRRTLIATAGTEARPTRHIELFHSIFTINDQHFWSKPFQDSFLEQILHVCRLKFFPTIMQDCDPIQALDDLRKKFSHLHLLSDRKAQMWRQP